jgi:hypothetical protein
MLKHGLQGFHNVKLLMPRSDAHKPNPAFLEARYTMFRNAS